jgi:lysyl-tRNA synthetase class 2
MPLLAAAPVTDVHLHALSTRYRGPGHDSGLDLWLQTSPEFAMKRLLAAGSGPIYSLGRAFRDGEAGSRHNPEFTMLEWYRPGWDHHRLMDEVEELLWTVLGSWGKVDASGSGGGPGDRDEGKSGSHGRVPGSNVVRRERGCVPGIPSHRAPGPRSERLTYAEAFRQHAGVDPFRDPVAALAARAAELLGHAPPDLGDDRDAWLELLLSHVIEPRLGMDGPTSIYDFPVSQAALARVRPGDPPVAERFETWVEGVELANGYHELTDPLEQRRRFDADLDARRLRGLPEVPIDERLLAALEHGLPECAGVALGVDRLVMLAVGATRIDEVIAFPVGRA